MLEWEKNLNDSGKIGSPVTVAPLPPPASADSCEVRTSFLAGNRTRYIKIQDEKLNTN